MTQYIDILIKTTNEKKDLEKTITETENTKNKVDPTSNIFFRSSKVSRPCLASCKRKVTTTWNRVIMNEDYWLFLISIIVSLYNQSMNIGLLLISLAPEYPYMIFDIILWARSSYWTTNFWLFWSTYFFLEGTSSRFYFFYTWS